MNQELFIPASIKTVAFFRNEQDNEKFALATMATRSQHCYGSNPVKLPFCTIDHSRSLTRLTLHVKYIRADWYACMVL